ncbi:MAG: glycoside hydrolase family 88 protein, partial [Flavobacterium piscis]|nr:glycoside hydrolase family 88 protein [Flavobacterium piscis]
MNYNLTKIITFFAIGICTNINAQTNDVTAPLHLMKPDYITPYVIPEKNNIENVLSRVYTFLEENTASKAIYVSDKSEVKDFKKAKGKIAFSAGAFRLTSYEWGVTYAGMLLAADVTGKKE